MELAPGSLRGLGVALLAAGAISLVSAPVLAEAPPAYGGRLDLVVYGEPVSVDPVDADHHAEATLIGLVFDTLYRIDADGRVVPHLAAGVPALAANGLTATIAVRSGIHFHDGTELDAHDVASSLRRLLRSRAGWILAAVRAVDVSGGSVVVRLRRPSPDLARVLSAPATSITLGGRAPTFARAVGTGPYRLVRRDQRAGTIELVAFDDYFAGRGYLDRIDLSWHRGADTEAREFELGRADTSLRGAVAFAGHVPKFAARTVETPASILVYAGLGDGLASEGFAQALSLALDRRSFRSIGSGERVEPSTSCIAAALGGNAGTLAPQRARAAHALARARQEDPALRQRLAAGAPIGVWVDVTRPDDRATADRVLTALFSLGLRGRVREVEPAALRAAVSTGRADLYVDHVVAPVARGPWQAAAALARTEPAWVAAQVRAAVPSLTWLGAHLSATGRSVPLYHRALRLQIRANLHGFSVAGNGVISPAGVFALGPPRRARGARR